jgi:hypothetical protein
VNRTTPLLEVSNLRVAFDGKEVVRGIDFTIQPGEKLALGGRVRLGQDRDGGESAAPGDACANHGNRRVSRA